MDKNNNKSTKSFRALVFTQFQGALNDNAYKTLLLVMAVSLVSSMEESKNWSSITMLIFTLPFLLFSMLGGSLADRFSKRNVIVYTKIWEIGAMAAAFLALATGNMWFCICVLFFTGAQAAVFGPSKYGIIPELVPEKRLSWANGIIELTTFAAIILGSVIGTLFLGFFKGNLQYAALVFIVLSVAGTITACMIEKTPAANPTQKIKINFVEDLVLNVIKARKDTILWMAILGNTFFWFLGAFLFTNIPIFSKYILHLHNTQITLLDMVLPLSLDTQMSLIMVSLAIGIGLGSFMAGRLSGNKIEYGLIPLGSLIISAFSLYLYFAVPTFGKTLFSLAMLGFGAGFYVVPMNALIQHRPSPEEKGTVQGVAYFLSNIGTLCGPGLFWILTVKMGMTPVDVFLVGAIINIAASAYYIYRLPDSLIRFILWALTRTFYRVKVIGRDNIPERGGALFITNHMSLTDALFLIASTDRFIRFIMYTGYYRIPWFNPFARIMKAIPMSADDGPRELIQSFREASNAIQNGDVVCIFAEGQITRIGQMLPFRRGFERIMKGVDAPIIPVHLDRIWGAIFSFKNGKLVWMPNHKIPQPVTVTFGEPLPGNTDVTVVRRKVHELSTLAFDHRIKDMKPLHHALFDEARRHPRRFAMADGMNPKVNYREVLIRSVILGKLMKPYWKDQEKVGLFMPPSVAGACLNYAALLCGKVPVNLNYTLSQESLDASIQQCGITTVVTAHAFMEKIKLTLPVKVLYLDDMAPNISKLDKLIGLLSALLLPIRTIEQSLGCVRSWNMNDICTVIFSSGSTGEPKGVLLTHSNIFCNVDGIAQVMTVEKTDRILGVLPFFHSFGFTGTLWFPLIKGFGVVYHPNPLDTKTIGTLSEEYQISLLVATPTFLQTYTKRIAPGQFGSLRFVMAGAEKLPQRIAEAFDERFGIRPYEAYGCTECSPGISVNTMSYRAKGFYQVGRKQGSIGHPLPGVSVRILDLETGEPVSIGQSGLLWVKGPNVMQGYLGQPELTAQVLKDGWYNTGDIASMDNDGFMTITDRLSRFSKIGGEMVPHIKIEETLHQIADLTEQTFVVTAVPDKNKGERLVVIHKMDPEQLKGVIEKLSTSGLPNLWIPKQDSFYQVETIPVLGTGKIDLKGVRDLALKLANSN